MQTKPTTTDRHMPLRMDHVVVLGDFTPLQKRCIARALNGQLSNKEQARAEQVSTHAIAHRWERIADAMRLPYGRRSRQHTLAELCRRHLVEFLCLALFLLPALVAINSGDNIDMRKRRGGRSRRGRYDSAMALDVDTLDEITDWPAWLDNNKPFQGAEPVTIEPNALTPIASIAIGVATGFTAYALGLEIPIFPAELAAETLGSAAGLIIHRRSQP